MYSKETKAMKSSSTGVLLAVKKLCVLCSVATISIWGSGNVAEDVVPAESLVELAPNLDRNLQQPGVNLDHPRFFTYKLNIHRYTQQGCRVRFIYDGGMYLISSNRWNTFVIKDAGSGAPSVDGITLIRFGWIKRYGNWIIEAKERYIAFEEADFMKKRLDMNLFAKCVTNRSLEEFSIVHRGAFDVPMKKYIKEVNEALGTNLQLYAFGPVVIV